jgi:hypothetical protein
MGKVQQIATLCSVWQQWTPNHKSVSVFSGIIFIIHMVAKCIVKKLSNAWSFTDLWYQLDGTLEEKWRTALSQKLILKMSEQAANEVFCAKDQWSRI